MYEEELDFTKLKYALYVRKSTDDPERQIRSIPDQIDECLKLASRMGLTIIGDPLEEKKSAKLPHLRPVFTQMLREVEDGKYDGILAWHPDRLARNMLEGGTIIDMLDQEILKDLKFVSHHFTNDPNGKMLLGMAFASRSSTQTSCP
jgi:site-specific DNA recombinase